MFLHDVEIGALHLEHVEVTDESLPRVQLPARRGHPREMPAVTQVVVGEGVALQEPDHQEERVLVELENRSADPRVRGRPGVEVLGLSIDGQQLAARLRDPHDHGAFRGGHLEVDVGQPTRELLDLAFAPPENVDRVQGRVELAHGSSLIPPRQPHGTVWKSSWTTGRVLGSLTSA